ncbi:ankyrin repeat-containing protein, conserved, putative [Eimeria mitis]|uniref:Ankyrin repeat-containing protein, conserved, putative n=1 Tax=Eimeria mitis TaxID=44415 RepID=U6KK06_9EIME|nr:ankyrin repeat-containing protein, conserved, putative [Eimeria mitis]CDJ36602.1 ankyrin repeat-containing protein, conserved, putative [Eimeria mitis]
MFSVASQPYREIRGGLASGIYTLSDAAEERLAAQRLFAGGPPEGSLTAYEAALKIQEQYMVKDEAQEAADRQKEEEQRGLRERRETDEILTLQQMLPELLQGGRIKEAEGAVCYFLDRNPHSADGFVLLAETYGHQRNPMGALTAIWGAIHNCPGNRRLLRLLAQYEEAFLMQCCELPLEFKVKALQVSEGPPPEGPPSTVGPLDSELHLQLHPQEAPVTVARHGSHMVAFANRSLSPGDLIFKEKPFVCTPIVLESGQVFSSCFHCLQERRDPSRAFSCPVSPNTCPFVFCSWGCLMANARLHSVECACMPLVFAAAKEAGLSVSFVLHLFRVLIKASLQRHAQIMRDSKEDEETLRCDVGTQLLRLNSFEAEVRKGQPELLQKLLLLMRRFQQSIPPNMLLHFTEPELLHVALVVLQYSPYVSAPSAAAAVQRRDPDCSLGHVFAPAAAMLHHSCVPTATITLDEDGQLAVRALTHIPPGGYICVSAEEDLFKAQKDRKALEAIPRVFGCGCIRCRENDEGGRLLRGVRCFKCIRGFLCPAKPTALLARLRAYGEAGLLPTSASSAGGGIPRETPQGDPKTADASRKQTPKTTAKPQPSTKSPQEKKSNATATPLEEQWLCNCCGLTGPQASLACEEMERDIQQRQKEADAYLLQGARQQAARCYSDIVDLYGSKLHPQHSALFNANTILAGLLAAQGGKDIPRALIVLRRAAMAAETVLPATSMVKVHLYLKLAELTYRAMQLGKQCRRGPSVPPEKIMEPLFCALWNCVACMGREATLSVSVCLRLRRFAAILSVSTPPLTHVPVVRTDDVFLALYKGATDSAAADPEEVRELFQRDPMSIAAGLVRRGLHFPLALELFKAMKDTQHLPTGLSLLGLACLYAHSPLVDALLKMGYDLFAQNSLGMTPLLVMCATRGSCLLSGEKGKFAGCLASESAAAAAAAAASSSAAADAEETEKSRLVILRLMLQHCDALDSREAAVDRHRVVDKRQSLSPSQVSSGTQEETKQAQGTGAGPLGPSRRRLLFSSTHRLLARSQALHFAASNGKTRLCRQLLAAGADVQALNMEGAMPLHLACVAGALETVKLLLERGAPINATTAAGETPLLLAAYWLQEDVMALLLQRGADPAVVARVEGLTVLHAVAAGVLRQTRPLFRGLAWEGDLAAVTLEGFSAETVARGTYTRGGCNASCPDTLIDLRLPSPTADDSDLLVFPGELMQRVQKAQGMLLSLSPHCNHCAYTRRTRRGFTPAELLLRSWEDFEARRNELLKLGDLRLAPLTSEEKVQLEERWRFVLHQIYVLRDLLSPHHLGETEGGNCGDETPRPEQIRENERQKMINAAPWLFNDEIARATQGNNGGAPVVETAAKG